MSIHRSLHGVNTLVGERSVLTRTERLERLKKEGRFDPESDSPQGLPKVRTKFRIKKKKGPEDEEVAETAEATEATEATEAAEEA